MFLILCSHIVRGCLSFKKLIVLETQEIQEKSGICMYLSNLVKLFFLFFKISQEIQTFLKLQPPLFNLHQSIFVYKKSGTVDNVCLNWSSSKV